MMHEAPDYPNLVLATYYTLLTTRYLLHDTYYTPPHGQRNGARM